VSLTAGEVQALCGELEHSPDCPVSEMVTVTVDTASQTCWADAECTIPYVAAECRCGLDALLASGKEKLKELAQ
jgi:hypothetical protein